MHAKLVLKRVLASVLASSMLFSGIAFADTDADTSVTRLL